MGTIVIHPHLHYLTTASTRSSSIPPCFISRSAPTRGQHTYVNVSLWTRPFLSPIARLVYARIHGHLLPVVRSVFYATQSCDYFCYLCIQFGLNTRGYPQQTGTRNRSNLMTRADIRPLRDGTWVWLNASQVVWSKRTILG